MSRATKAVAVGSVMLPLGAAQTIASQRGVEDGFRDEETWRARPKPLEDGKQRRPRLGDRLK